MGYAEEIINRPTYKEGQLINYVFAFRMTREIRLNILDQMEW